MTVTQMCDAPEVVNDAKERLNTTIFNELLGAKGIGSIAELSRLTRERGSYVSRATIFRLISGERQATLRVAKALAGVLGTTVDTLFAPAGRAQ